MGMRLARQDAEDIAQETFLSILKSIGRYRGGHEWAYVKTAAYRRALNRITRTDDGRLPSTAEDIDEADPRQSAEEELIRREQTEDFQRKFAEVMDALSDTTRQAFLLYLRGWSYKEIATALSIPTHSVGTRLELARQKLRERVGALPERIDGIVLTEEDHHDRKE